MEYISMLLGTVDPVHGTDQDQAGYESLQVRCNVVREQAHRFYERLGFQSRKTQKVLARPL